MRKILAIVVSMASISLAAHPYSGEMSMFEDGAQVSRSYQQMLEEQPVAELSPLSKAIHEAALSVLRNPDSEASKEAYLTNFPREFVTFTQVFNPTEFDQLYDGFLYIGLLGSLGDEYPEVVGEIYLKLASEACLAADAPNYLRHHMMDFKRRYPLIYQKHKDKLTPAHRKNVALFESASLSDSGEGLCTD